MYAVRDTDVIVPDGGGAPVYEGLRLARPRAGAPGEFDFLEFGQILSTDQGEKIGLRAAGSPSWQLIAYTGTLGGSPLAPTDFPRDGGPMWPEDDDTRTAAAIEKKLEDAIRHRTFESLGWKGASDAWLEKWWPRFAERITEGLASSFRGIKVPVVDEEGLAIGSGAELRGAVVLPPTRDGWQQYLELAPKSGESFTTLREAGLSWWDRKIPPNLLSKEKTPASSAIGAASEDASSTRVPIAATGEEAAPPVGSPPAASPSPAAGAGTPKPGAAALSPAERAEEARMGEALRAARDKEEAEWADAVDRGTKIEMARGLGTEARRTAIQNLGRDIKHYDRPQRPFEEARSAIKALGLPPKRYVYYVRQAEEAVADGKSFLPVVARARKAAEKVAQKSAPSKQPGTAASPSRSSEFLSASAIEAVVGTFNAEPRWRAEVHRRLPNGRYILVIHPEGARPGRRRGIDRRRQLRGGRSPLVTRDPGAGAGRHPGAHRPGALGRLRRREPPRRIRTTPTRSEW
jgi:hypothetical protein